ncbi:MAG: type IX secretion system membrane protein PorP/SprF, partial [Anaerolineales bacterium]|nr:type IX secretion system membrane protein PorP/SprF [Anaerolineales bacterium]
AQLYPVSNHYINNSFAINPAVAGSDGALHVSLSYRNQWVGIEGSPKTMTLAIHTPLKNDKIGLGFLLLNDTYGIYHSTTFGGNYAYKIELGKGNLSFGRSFSATIMEERWNELVSIDSDDEQLIYSSSKAVVPNFSTGMYYKTADYFIGFSIPGLFSNKLNAINNKYTLQSDFSKYNYFVYGGYQFRLSDQFQLFPSLLTKYSSESGAQLDLTAQFVFMERIWLGVTYKSDATIVGLFQVNLNKQATVAYSYDFKTGAFLAKPGSSHEIMLKYVFKYDLQVVSPR